MQIQENYRGIIMGTASNEEIIYGKNAVTEALKAEKPIDTVFVLKGAQDRRVLPLFPGGGAAYGAKAGICPDR